VDLYTVLAAGFRLGWRALDLDVQPIGHEHIPDAGPVILASNHIGYLDFCFVALAPPRPRRQVRFMARHDIFERPVVGWAMRTMKQIPVDVHGDPTRSLEVAEQRLRDGEIVGIHPESTISPSFVPRTGRTGAVRLAERTGAPIVPVAIWGSQRLLTKWRPERFTRHVAVLVRYGEPFHPASSDPADATAEVMERITELLAKNQAAYPQRPGPEPEADWWLPSHLGGSAPTPEEAEQRLRDQAAQRRRRAEEEGRRGRDDEPPAAQAPGA
jgi:1-acyl-sn-glycerol-3-phosphate acyltransferase